LCFQVLDDLADGQVSQATPGGHVAEDHSRATFVSVLGAERAQEFSEQLVHDAVRALEPIGPAADPLAKLAQHVLYSTQRFTPQR
jgi:geranylgeranyl pyrophosphate synthase